MLKRAATVVWWLGAMCAAGGLLGMLRSNGLHEIWIGPAIGAMGAAFFCSCAYILGGTFLRPPTGLLSQQDSK